MTTVTGQRRRISPWVVIAGIVGIVGVAWALTSLATGTGSGGATTGPVHSLLPNHFSAATTTPAELHAAFAAEGLPLTPAISDVAAARFQPLRSHVAGAYTLAGPAAMLIVLFDRTEPRAASKLLDGSAGRDSGESIGRIYLEYRSDGLDHATAAAVRRALRRLLH